jgi:hypothetical protein
MSVGLGHPLERRFRRLLRAGRGGLLDRIVHRFGPDAAAGLLVAIAAAIAIAAPVRFIRFDTPGAGPAGAHDGVVHRVVIRDQIVRTIVR